MTDRQNDSDPKATEATGEPPWMPKSGDSVVIIFGDCSPIGTNYRPVKVVHALPGWRFLLGDGSDVFLDKHITELQPAAGYPDAEHASRSAVGSRDLDGQEPMTEATEIEWTDADGATWSLAREGRTRNGITVGWRSRPATPADIAAAIRAMPSSQRTRLLVDVVEDSSAIGRVRGELARLEAKLTDMVLRERLNAAEAKADQWEQECSAERESHTETACLLRKEAALLRAERAERKRVVAELRFDEKEKPFAFELQQPVRILVNQATGVVADRARLYGLENRYRVRGSFGDFWWFDESQLEPAQPATGGTESELFALRKVRDAAVSMATLLEGYDHNPQDLSGRLLANFKEALEEARKVSGQ